jgi:hypothetical protein
MSVANAKPHNDNLISSDEAVGGMPHLHIWFHHLQFVSHCLDQASI